MHNLQEFTDESQKSYRLEDFKYALFAVTFQIANLYFRRNAFCLDSARFDQAASHFSDLKTVFEFFGGLLHSCLVLTNITK